MFRSTTAVVKDIPLPKVLMINAASTPILKHAHVNLDSECSAVDLINGRHKMSWEEGAELTS